MLSWRLQLTRIWNLESRKRLLMQGVCERWQAKLSYACEANTNEYIKKCESSVWNISLGIKVCQNLQISWRLRSIKGYLKKWGGKCKTRFLVSVYHLRIRKEKQPLQGVACRAPTIGQKCIKKQSFMKPLLRRGSWKWGSTSSLFEVGRK